MHKGSFFTAHGELNETPWTHWEVAILMLPIWIMILMDGWKYKLRGWSLKPKPSNLQTGDVIIWLSTLNGRETHRAVDWCFNLETNKKGIKKTPTSILRCCLSIICIHLHQTIAKPIQVSMMRRKWWENMSKFHEIPRCSMYGIFTYISPMKTKQIPLDPRHRLVGRSATKTDHLGMVNIPPIKMVMTGGWFIMVPTLIRKVMLIKVINGNNGSLVKDYFPMQHQFPTSQHWNVPSPRLPEWNSWISQHWSWARAWERTRQGARCTPGTLHVLEVNDIIEIYSWEMLGKSMEIIKYHLVM